MKSAVVADVDAPPNSLEERTSLIGRLFMCHINPLQRLSRQRVLTEDDIGTVIYEDRADVAAARFLALWEQACTNVDVTFFYGCMKSVRRADHRNELVSETKWATLESLVKKDTYKSFKDLHLFQQEVHKMVGDSYKDNDVPPHMMDLPAAVKKKIQQHLPKKTVRLQKIGEQIETALRACSPSVWGVLMKQFWKQFVIGGTWGLVQGFAPLCPIALVPRTAAMLSEDDPEIQGLIWGGVIFAAFFVLAIAQSILFSLAIHLAIQVRAALSTALFEKSIKLSCNGWRVMKGHAKIYQLLQSDVDQIFRQANGLVGIIFFLPCQAIFSVALLVYYFSWVALLGTLVLCVTIRYNYSVTDSFIDSMIAKQAFADSRVTSTEELVRSIRGVKFYGWEDRYIEKICSFREKEIPIIRNLMWKIGMLIASVTAAPMVFQTVILAIFAAWREEDLTPALVVQSLALAGLLKIAVLLLPFAWSGFLMAKASALRIQYFLGQDEMAKRVLPDVQDGCVRVRSASVGYDPQLPPHFSNIDITIGRGELVMIVGQVGSGKTTCLRTLLNELNLLNGSVHVGADVVSYCAQDPWIFHGTVRQNILWNKELDWDKYLDTLWCVDMLSDVENLMGGDNCEIGEKGINISGGQKARVSLARAVYADADMYFLDDVLSAVDAHVGRNIFERCIMSRLAGKTRVVVTNQLQFIDVADRVYVVRDGKVVQESVDIARSTMPEDMTKSTGLQVLLYGFDKGTARTETEEDRVNQAKPEQTEAHAMKRQDTPNNVDRNRMAAVRSKVEQSAVLVKQEEAEEGDVTMSTYLAYLGAVGGCFFWLAQVIFQSLSNSLQIFSPVWLGWFANEDGVQSFGPYVGRIIRGDQHTGFWLGIYLGLILLAAAAVLSQQFFMAIGAVRPSKFLFRRQLEAVAKSPMSFFDSTPMGRIITTFTADWSQMDFMVPMLTSNVLGMGVNVIFLGLMVGISLWPMLIVIFVIFSFLGVTARREKMMLQMRRIFNRTKGPLSSSFDEMLSGVASVRAYRQEDFTTRLMKRRMDMSSAAFAGEKFGLERLRLILNLATGFLMFAVTALTGLFHDVVDPTAGGLMVAFLLNAATMFPYLLMMFFEMDMSQAATERILLYCRLPPEEPRTFTYAGPSVPADWPASGEIIIKNLAVRYRPDLPVVLRGVNLDIQAAWKVGIVGRTGCGKSTILKVLLRLMHPEPGFELLIDGVKAHLLALKELRGAFAIIPQEPIVFRGTVGSNIDPFETRDEEGRLEAMRNCHIESSLRERAKQQDKDSPLEVTVSEDTMSVGQRQMVCLARALVLDRKILLLDEATASVDVHTDALIQQTIREAFAKCTVMTIAHRLNTIIDADRLLVLDRDEEGIGRICQFGSFKDLMRDKAGVFYNLAKQANIAAPEDDEVGTCSI